MRKLFTLLFVALSANVLAQPPGYYTSANGLNGQDLRLALRNIIRTHTTLSYTPGLWNAYYTTDVKPNGKLWDVYSDIPGGTPAYEYTLGTDQCGSAGPTAEGGCYNREHTWPQSKFASDTPMKNDLFIAYPTDYIVNNRRGDFPYGKVGTATQTFTNGSKIGNNTYSGAPSGSCFEPIDSFKGDLARTYFYISTCYRNDSNLFTSWEMANQVALTPWAAQMLLEWHHNDPVSKKEVDRNNAAYVLQANRNPFIDHPEYADCIWGTGDCSSLATGSVATTQGHFTMFPIPAVSNTTIAWRANEDAQIVVHDINGRIVLTVNEAGGKLAINVADWPKGIYMVQLVTATWTGMQKLVVE